MKICMIASTYPRFADDGSGRFVKSLAEALAGHGHEIHVLAPYHPRIQPYEGPEERHYFRYVRPDSWAIMGYAGAMDSDRRIRARAFLLAPQFFLCGALALRRLALRHRYDLLHAHWVLPNGAIAALVARWQRIPLAVTLHGSDIFAARRNRFLGGIARQTFRQAQQVTACSQELVDGALALGADRSRLHLIPWGADAMRFGPTQGSDRLLRRWGLAAGDLVVLSLGRLVHKKGLEYLLRAIPETLQQVKSVRFLIVGEGPEQPRLIELARNLGITEAVLFAGEVPWDEVAEYLQLCDVFVAPSIHDQDGNVDGLPTTILEAMASGKPVIASRVAGIPLVVSHAETGLLVPERDAPSLSAALVKLLSSTVLREAYGRAARHRVECDLNWNQISRQFERLYQAACGIR